MTSQRRLRPLPPFPGLVEALAAHDRLTATLPRRVRVVDVGILPPDLAKMAISQREASV